MVSSDGLPETGMESGASGGIGLSSASPNMSKMVDTIESGSLAWVDDGTDAISPMTGRD